ncbi:hypothetical protein EVAR_56529_1, partial [Eumeta japonica]
RAACVLEGNNLPSCAEPRRARSATIRLLSVGFSTRRRVQTNNCAMSTAFTRDNGERRKGARPAQLSLGRPPPPAGRALRPRGPRPPAPRRTLCPSVRRRRSVVSYVVTGCAAEQPCGEVKLSNVLTIPTRYIRTPQPSATRYHESAFRIHCLCDLCVSEVVSPFWKIGLYERIMALASKSPISTAGARVARPPSPPLEIQS